MSPRLKFKPSVWLKENIYYWLNCVEFSTIPYCYWQSIKIQLMNQTLSWQCCCEEKILSIGKRKKELETISDNVFFFHQGNDKIFSKCHASCICYQYILSQHVGKIKKANLGRWCAALRLAADDTRDPGKSIAFPFQLTYENCTIIRLDTYDLSV